MILNAENDSSCPLDGVKLACAAAEEASKRVEATDKLKIPAAQGAGHTITGEQRQMVLAVRQIAIQTGVATSGGRGWTPHFEVVLQNLPFLLEGLVSTLQLAGSVGVLAFALGIVVAFARLSRVGPIHLATNQVRVELLHAKYPDQPVCLEFAFNGQTLTAGLTPAPWLQDLPGPEQRALRYALSVLFQLAQSEETGERKFWPLAA